MAEKIILAEGTIDLSLEAQAQATADSASETATQAKDTAQAVEGIATEAKTSAENAQNIANEASANATAAQTTAESANAAAETANNNAIAAQESADEAAKTATDYISESTTVENAIFIHNQDDSQSGIYIDSDSVDVVKYGTPLATFGSEVVIGNAETGQTAISNTGIKISVNSNNSLLDVASFTTNGTNLSGNTNISGDVRLTGDLYPNGSNYPIGYVFTEINDATRSSDNSSWSWIMAAEIPKGTWLVWARLRSDSPVSSARTVRWNLSFTENGSSIWSTKYTGAGQYVADNITTIISTDKPRWLYINAASTSPIIYGSMTQIMAVKIA